MSQIQKATSFSLTGKTPVCSILHIIEQYNLIILLNQSSTLQKNDINVVQTNTKDQNISCNTSGNVTPLALDIPVTK